MNQILSWVSSIISEISNLLFNIISAVLSIVTKLIHSLLYYIATNIMGQFTPGKELFDSTDAVGNLVNTFHAKFLIIGAAVLILVASWHIFKGFFGFLGLGTEQEEPWKIGLKIIMFGFLLISSKQICQFIIEGPFQEILKAFKADGMTSSTLTWGNTFFKAVEGITISPSEIGAESETATIAIGAFSIVAGGFIKTLLTILQFFFFISVDLKIIGIALNLVEKYIKTAFLIMISPIAFACGVTKATGQIFNSWVKNFTGVLAVQFLQYALLGMFNYYFINSTGGESATLTGISTIIKTFVIMMALLSLVEQAEDIIRDLGIQAGRTSGVVTSPIRQGARYAGDMAMRNYGGTRRE